MRDIGKSASYNRARGRNRGKPAHAVNTLGLSQRIKDASHHGICAEFPLRRCHWGCNLSGLREARTVGQAWGGTDDPFEFLPAPSSSITPLPPPLQQYVAAQQMMVKGRLREAQDQYLQILLARSLIDQQAMRGLTKVEGLLANGDPEVLQRQAETYRQAIVQGSATGEPYTPRALELLSEANLLAAREIGTEQAPRPTAIGASVPTGSGIPQNGAGSGGSWGGTVKGGTGAGQGNSISWGSINEEAPSPDKRINRQ